jgi:hypothetical protein
MLEIFSQTTPPPQDLVTLQWIIIGVLATVTAYLFRQLRKSDKDRQKLIEKVLVGLGDTSDAMRSLADVVDGMKEHFSLRDEIDKLRREIHNANEE